MGLKHNYMVRRQDMQETLFLKILKRWRILDKKEKLKDLQAFESLNAKFENRREREIILSGLGATGQLNTDAQYCKDKPDFIILNDNFSNKSATSTMGAIFHEGFHADVDDYFNRNGDLKALAHIDDARLKEEYSLKDIIYNRATHKDLVPLFALQYYEEKLVRQETCLYLIHNLLQCCETENDVKMLFDTYYYEILGELFNYNTFCESNRNFSYEAYQQQLYGPVKNFDAQIFKQYILDTATSGSIVSGIDPNILKHFNKNYELFLQSQRNVRNPQRLREIINKMMKNINTDAHTI